MDPSQDPKRRGIERSIEWTGCASFDQDWTWDPLKHQEEALAHLIYVQEWLDQPLFGPWCFDNKAAHFVLVSASLVMWCFHVFCGILTSIGFPIIYENIDYFL
jgi:hypothetical protein